MRKLSELFKALGIGSTIRAGCAPEAMEVLALRPIGMRIKITLQYARLFFYSLFSTLFYTLLWFLFTKATFRLSSMPSASACRSVQRRSVMARLVTFARSANCNGVSCFVWNCLYSLSAGLNGQHCRVPIPGKDGRVVPYFAAGLSGTDAPADQGRIFESRPRAFIRTGAPAAEIQGFFLQSQEGRGHS